MTELKENIIDWYTEASAIIADVKQHVKTIEISEKLITGKFSFLSDWNEL